MAGPEKDPAKILIPLELCKILPGQPQTEMGVELLAELIKDTAMTPDRRFPLIERVLVEEARQPRTRTRRGPHQSPCVPHPSKPPAPCLAVRASARLVGAVGAAALRGLRRDRRAAAGHLRGARARAV